jgi:hypothetical protein
MQQVFVYQETSELYTFHIDLMTSCGGLGLEPIVIEEQLIGDELRTHVVQIEATLQALGGASRIVAIISITSCFSPRAPDE